MSLITISSIFEQDFDDFCDFCGNTCVSYLIDTTGYEDGLTEYIFRPIWFRYLHTPIKFSNDEKGKEAFLRNFCNQLNEVVFDFYTYCKENIDYFMYQTNPLNEGKPMSKSITSGINPINQNVDQAVDSTNLATGTSGQFITETVYNGVAWHKLVDAYFTPNRKTSLLKAFAWLFVTTYSPETKYDDKIEEVRYVQLSFVDEDNNIIDEQKVLPTKSYFTMSEVDIQRPLMLDPQNIKKDVDIAGIVGTYEPNIYPRIYDLLRLDNPDGIIVYNTPSGYDGIEGVEITIPSSAAPENIKQGVNIGGIVGTYVGGVDNLEKRVDNNSGATPYAYDNSNITKLLPYAFYSDKNITYFKCNSVTEIDKYAFYECSNLTYVEMNNVNMVSGNSGYIFNKATNLATLKLNSLTSINGPNNFSNTGLTSIYLPALTTMDTNGTASFMDCTSLANVDFPVFTGPIKSNTFRRCSSLITANINKPTLIDGYAFADCTSLTDITISKTSVAILSNVTAFNNLTGPINIHVPSSTISSYQTASNWSILYNNGVVTFVAI